MSYIRNKYKKDLSQLNNNCRRYTSKQVTGSQGFEEVKEMSYSEKKFYPLYYKGVKQEFAKAIVVGNLAFLSGMSGRTTETGEVSSGDVSEQLQVAMRKIKHSLEDMGLTIGNIVKYTTYLKQGEDTQKVLRETKDLLYNYAPILREEPPAATLVVVSGLYYEDMKIELDVIACITS